MLIILQAIAIAAVLFNQTAPQIIQAANRHTLDPMRDTMHQWVDLPTIHSLSPDLINDVIRVCPNCPSI